MAAAMGMQRTEIDALAALRPELLRQIARDALTGSTTARSTAGGRYRTNGSSRTQVIDRGQVRPGPAGRNPPAPKSARGMREQIRELNDALRIDVDPGDLPPIDLPGPVTPEGNGLPLLDSRWPFTEQCRALIASKAYRRPVTAMAGSKDRWHQLADAIDASNLAASDKAVLRRLLDRADYRTAELPEKFTPKQADIARKASITPRQVRRSLRHAERHGWVTVGGTTGRGHRLAYRLDIGEQCGCSGRVHERREDTEHRKGGHGVPLKADTKGGHAAGQTPNRTERHREGEGGRDV